MKKIFIVNLMMLLIFSYNTCNANQQQYKGVILDIARQHYSTNSIKKIIDVIDKNNGQYLQLHFSDNENYAIESKYINTTKNALTQSQIKEIIQYANHKNIEIIPDFDIPGHSNYWMTHLKDNVDIATDYDKDVVDFYNNESF